METKTCLSCKGSKVTIREAFVYTDSRDGKQTHYPRSEKPCNSCDGRGYFDKPHHTHIFEAIKGRSKGLRSARPKDSVAYYVWRMARFHGGQDVTMPMMAGIENHGNPWLSELDTLAEEVAKRVYGSDMAGAHRWGRALGIISRDVPGLPGTAYESGPVLDSGVTKPDEEIPELK